MLKLSDMEQEEGYELLLDSLATNDLLGIRKNLWIDSDYDLVDVMVYRRMAMSEIKGPDLVKLRTTLLQATDPRVNAIFDFISRHNIQNVPELIGHLLQPPVQEQQPVQEQETPFEPVTEEGPVIPTQPLDAPVIETQPLDAPVIAEETRSVFSSGSIDIFGDTPTKPPITPVKNDLGIEELEQRKRLEEEEESKVTEVEEVKQDISEPSSTVGISKDDLEDLLVNVMSMYVKKDINDKAIHIVDAIKEASDISPIINNIQESHETLGERLDSKYENYDLNHKDLIEIIRTSEETILGEITRAVQPSVQYTDTDTILSEISALRTELGTVRDEKPVVHNPISGTERKLIDNYTISDGLSKYLKSNTNTKFDVSGEVNGIRTIDMLEGQVELLQDKQELVLEFLLLKHPFILIEFIQEILGIDL